MRKYRALCLVFIFSVLWLTGLRRASAGNAGAGECADIGGFEGKSVGKFAGRICGTGRERDGLGKLF